MWLGGSISQRTDSSDAVASDGAERLAKATMPTIASVATSLNSGFMRSSRYRAVSPCS